MGIKLYKGYCKGVKKRKMRFFRTKGRRFQLMG